MLPFLTILDQTVKIYKTLFAELGEHYILEHHSLTGTRPQDVVVSSETEKEARLLSQNWDAPIVITTSVQLLESLFANRPSACRKLHHLQDSIILFDEVQTLPLPLAVPTLKALARLASDAYGTTVVFSTATQPAFETLDKAVREEEDNAGWEPEEIAPASLGLYAEARRVEADWEHALTPTSWATVSSWLTEAPQSLCVVNVKRHARELVETLRSGQADGLFHLTTALCPAHRRSVLEKIHTALELGKPCRLVATQCVEAGVDLDFPRAFRSLGPLEAIAQAAGRCNRSGKAAVPGTLSVFLPEEERYPTDAIYKRATQLTKLLLREKGNLDINNPALFAEYFRRLYNLSELNDKALADAIHRQDYVEVSRLYRLIEDNTVNVVVPYNARAIALMDEAVTYGITGGWIRQVRAYTVTLFRPQNGKLPSFLETTKMKHTQKPAEDWYVCRMKEFYDKEMFGFEPDASAGSGCYTV